MTTHISISWNPDREDETKVTVSKEFDGLQTIEQLDCLKDALGELTAIYNARLAVWHPVLCF